MQCRDFQCEYGIWSGPGAEVFQDGPSVWDTSPGVSGEQFTKRDNVRRGGGGGLGGKKWDRRVSAVCVGLAGPWEAGETLWGAAESESLGRPNGLRSG